MRHWWENVERLALSGSNDRGDLIGVPGVTIECKDARRFELAGWSKETEIERLNNGDEFGMLIVKHAQKPVSEAYAIFPLAQAAELIYRATKGSD